ncbi:hypothetical protein FJZ31_43170, partial [Candidatus Poribacteria bacterium]|nr:hypothetical protein [Candidatus Poribacteria bacterium]
FGILSIPIFFFLARQFSSRIAIPCALSLAFMTYHISLSQDARSYTFLMFLGMVSLFFFMKHLHTQDRAYLFLIAISSAILFYTSYSSILFIIFSQMLWFYRTSRNQKPFPSVLILNGLILLFCLPWIIFLMSYYKGQPFTDLRNIPEPISLLNVLYGIIHDWLPLTPLIVISIVLLILFVFFTINRRNAIVLLSIIIAPVVGLHLYCRLFNITHFVTSRYFICFLPLFFIILFLSLDSIEAKVNKLKNLKIFFLILILASNLVILPLYYRAEKQDYRGLVTYLKTQLRNGDKVIVGNVPYIGVMLHYFGILPTERHYIIPARIVSKGEIEHIIDIVYQNIRFSIIYSKSHWFEYLKDGSRLWIVADKENAKMIMDRMPCTLKGYFDGSFMNMVRFPSDVSLYLFLWDPSSPDEKGIEMPID